MEKTEFITESHARDFYNSSKIAKIIVSPKMLEQMYELQSREILELRQQIKELETKLFISEPMKSE